MEAIILDSNKRYTFANYLTWIDEKRRELIDGFVFMMSGPTRRHQKISGRLFLRFGNYLEKKKCEVYSAPFDVRLPKNGETDNNKIYNVVQPDIVIVCDQSKLDEKGCIGPPDLIVEILSANTSKKDLKDKFFLYEKSGVIEYWIAYPNEKSINVFILNPKGKYELKGMYVEGDTVSPSMLLDLSLEIEDVFKM